MLAPFFVDDSLIVGTDSAEFRSNHQLVLNLFASKDMKEASQFVGFTITRDRANHILKIAQPDYIQEVVKRFLPYAEKQTNLPLRRLAAVSVCQWEGVRLDFAHSEGLPRCTGALCGATPDRFVPAEVGVSARGDANYSAGPADVCSRNGDVYGWRIPRPYGYYGRQI